MTEEWVQNQSNKQEEDDDDQWINQSEKNDTEQNQPKQNQPKRQQIVQENKVNEETDTNWLENKQEKKAEDQQTQGRPTGRVNLIPTTATSQRQVGRPGQQNEDYRPRQQEGGFRGGFNNGGYNNERGGFNNERGGYNRTFGNRQSDDRPGGGFRGGFRGRGGGYGDRTNDRNNFGDRNNGQRNGQRNYKNGESGFERKPYNNNGYQRKPYNDNGFNQRKPYNNEEGNQRKPYNDKRNYDYNREERKPYQNEGFKRNQENVQIKRNYNEQRPVDRNYKTEVNKVSDAPKAEHKISSQPDEKNQKIPETWVSAIKLPKQRPQESVYLNGTKISVVYANILEEKKDVIFLPFENGNLQIFPGSSLANINPKVRERINAKKNIWENTEGAVFSMKYNVKFKGIIFIRLPGLKAGLKNAFGEYNSISTDFTSITMGFIGNSSNITDTAKQMIEAIIKEFETKQNSKIKELSICVKDKQQFRELRTVFREVVDQYIEKNEVFLD